MNADLIRRMSDPGSLSRRRTVVLLGALSGLAILWTLLTATPNPSADAINDWLVTKAAVDGLDPTSPPRQLAETYGITDVWNPVPHPRPPSAVLLQLPLVLVTHIGAWMIMSTIASVSMAVILARLWGLLGLAAAVPMIFVVGDSWGSQGTLVAMLILLAVESRSHRLGGILLGLAICLKLWPLIFVFALERRRAVWAAGLFVVLLAAGSLLVPPMEAVAAMSETTRLFLWSGTNASTASALMRAGLAQGPATWLSVLGGAAWWLRHRTPEAAAIAGLLISPLVWGSYQWVLAPTVRHGGLFGVAAAGLWLSPFHNGWVYLGVTVFCLTAVEFRSGSCRSVPWQRRPSHPFFLSEIDRIGASLGLGARAANRLG